ncbi:polysaccharide biosynthesis tyrosine autokinase [Ferrimonas gelatinilytica]|uniref:non-specific protein-tyrosine kinase n=1 Tax=Ferrimonas gelatinilytica TaxID=1255257 RepID=A0ABP9SCU2_9GAMM
MLSEITNEGRQPEAPLEWVGLTQRAVSLWRYRWWIILFTLLVSAVGYAYIAAMPPVYHAQVTLLLEKQQSNVVSIDEVYGLDTSADEYFQTQYQIMESRKIAEQVVDKVGLMSVPEFRGDQGLALGMLRQWLNRHLPWRRDNTPLSEEEIAYRLKQKVLSRYFERLTIIPIRSTQLVKVQFASEDPHLAAAVANAIAETYIESHMENKVTATEQATHWMQGRLELLKTNLRSSELALQQFRDQAGLVDVEGLLTLESQQLEDLSSRLNDAKARRSAAQTVARSVAAAGGSSFEQLAALPEMNRHPSVQQLRKAETVAEQKVAQLANRYGPKHKNMVAAKAELTEVRTALRRQIRQLVEGVQQEYQAASEEEASLMKELDAARSNYQGLSKSETEYRELLREVEANRQLYETFMTRIKETGIAGDFNQAIARVTDPALPPLTPAEPKKGLLMGGTIAFALALSCTIAVLYSRFADVISRADEVESTLKAKLLGIVPNTRFLNREQAARGYFDSQRPAFGESWRSIRTTLSLQDNFSYPMTLAISSAAPEEGKSTCAISLAQALAQIKSVLLVDCDLRRPTIGTSFKLPEYQPGLTNAVKGTHSLAQCVHFDSESGVSVLGAGTALANPLESLSGDGFRQLLEKARADYDVVILDTPPINSVSDGLVVGQLAGNLVFVVRSESTRIKLAHRALAQILKNRIRLTGVILNRVSGEAMQAQYGKRYDRYYGHGYREKKGTTEKCESAA